MPNKTINTFTSYELTEEETLNGSILNPHQLYVIQNELSQVAEQILSLEFDPAASPIKFAQDEAFLKGQMSILRTMLLRSEESLVSLRNAAFS